MCVLRGKKERKRREETEASVLGLPGKQTWDGISAQEFLKLPSGLKTAMLLLLFLLHSCLLLSL